MRGYSIRIGQSILNRQSHIGTAKLSHNRAILILYHGMYNTLRMNHYLNLIIAYIIEPSGFNNLQPLIYQGSGIYRNLLSHIPGWMSQYILLRYIGQLLCLTAPERPTRSSKNQLFDSLSILSLQALEQSTMFTVHWQNSPAQLLGLSHNQLTSHHQGFLISQSNILANLQSCQGRLQTSKSHQGGYYHLSLWISRCLYYSLTASCQLCFTVISLPQSAISFLVRKHRQLWLKFLYLLFQQFITAIGYQYRHMKQIWMLPYHIQGLSTNGTSGA